MDALVFALRILLLLLVVGAFFLLTIGIVLLAYAFRRVGQHILDTGIQPKHWFMNTPPEDVPTSAFWGHALRLGGLFGYVMAVGVAAVALSAIIQTLLLS